VKNYLFIFYFLLHLSILDLYAQESFAPSKGKSEVYIIRNGSYNMLGMLNTISLYNNNGSTGFVVEVGLNCHERIGLLF